MMATFKGAAIRRLMGILMAACIAASYTTNAGKAAGVGDQKPMTHLLWIQYDGTIFEVIDSEVLPIEYQAPDPTPGDIRFQIQSATGNVLFSGQFEDPRELMVDRISEDGQFIGDTLTLDKTIFCLKVPYTEDAAWLRITPTNGPEATVSLYHAPPTLASAAAAGSTLPNYTTQIIIDNGPARNRLDIVFLGDGYKLKEMDKLDRDVRTFAEYLLNTPPYSEYRSLINVHKVNVISNQSGIDHPKKGIFRDTALDMAFDYYDVHEAVYTPFESEHKVYRAAALVPQADLIVVLANDSEFGGSSGQLKNFSVVTTNPKCLDLLVHELGHSFAFLADESEGSSAPPLREPTKINVTLERTAEGLKKVGKWDYWLNPGQPTPTPPGFPGIGLFEGGFGAYAGVYRPKHTCKMRNLGAPFCEVCREQIVRRLYYIIRPIDNVSSQPQNAMSQQAPSDMLTYSVTPIRPSNHALTIEWFLDGVLQDHHGETFSIQTPSLSPGDHTVTVVVTDRTGYVRRDPTNLLSQRQSWTLKV